jgi:hypothetical protein
MAGLIAALFGGKKVAPDPSPNPGIGGYTLPAGPTGATGFPGSTSQTRALRGRGPRVAKIRADRDSGFEQGFGTALQVRQMSARGGGTPGHVNPRATAYVATVQTLMAQQMQNNSAAEFFGGPMLHTGPGNLTAGGNPLRAAAAAGGHSAQDTQTPAVGRQPNISGGVPGSQNVRNSRAQRYKNTPGQLHTYLSAARADQAPPNAGGQATDGNVHPERASGAVSVPSRYVWAGGGVQTWGALRQMPYTGRGNGARGAELSGQRYFAQGQSDQFFNAGMGDYGIGRIQGSGVGRPVGFTQPAPWSSNFYDTTDSVGTPTTPGTNAQSPDMVYVSPAGGRASNSTGRVH